MQLNHDNSKFAPHTFPITLVCDNVTKAPNIGSLFRISDAFGVEKLVLCGENIPLGRRFTKTSRATEKTLNYEVKSDITEVISTLKKHNYFIIALEITADSQPITTFKTNSDQPIALIVGDENFGISKSVLSMADAILHINMYGHNSSMNVVQAANIALYELTKQLIV